VTTSVSIIRQRLRSLAEPERARFLQGYFKTAEPFLGIRVPVLRTLAREYRTLSLTEVTPLLRSRVHEERHLALMILVSAYAKVEPLKRAAIYRVYMKHRRYINNWDLVDSSAPGIVGAHLTTKGRQTLDVLARSMNVWDRRIAIIATHHFIKRGEYRDTVRVASMLLTDEHDLIHKATGWMLRELGKRAPATLHGFLDAHAGHMPRTMLRYAIERLPLTVQRRYRDRAADEKALHE
jgi:3-methyladenine DNA glycosylase AlkD